MRHHRPNAGQRYRATRAVLAATGIALLASILISGGVSAFPVFYHNRRHHAAERPIPIAVFGRDDRQAPAKNYAATLRRSIGELKNTRNGRTCTAVCVADTMIATAGHCLAPPGNNGKPDPAQFQLNMGDNRHVSTAATAITLGTAQLRTTAPINAAEDWALARLAQPLCKGGSLTIHALSPGDRRWQTPFLAAYHQDRRADLLVSDGCTARAAQPTQDFKPSDKLIFHDCDTAPGSSGAPLLVSGPGGLTIVAISTGTFVETRFETSRTGPASTGQRKAVANTAVDASAFFGAFEKATMKTMKQPIKQKAGDRLPRHPE